MKICKAAALLFACFLTVSCRNSGGVLFTDKDNKPLPQYNAHVPVLRLYYPQEIKPIIIDEGAYHFFDINTRTVHLDTKNTHAHKFPQLAAHEAAHIINYDISYGFSLEEQPRFIDEGMAQLIQVYVADGEVLSYRDMITNCKVKNRAEGVKPTLADLMKWKTYCGDYMNVENFYKTANYERYHEATSFVYFLTETYGNDILYKIFKDLAATKDLNKTFENILKKNTAQIEDMWHAYIDKSVCKHDR